MMKYFLSEFCILLSYFLLINSTSDTSYDEDLVHSFLIKPEKLRKSERLKTAGENWLEKSAYKVKIDILAVITFFHHLSSRARDKFCCY